MRIAYSTARFGAMLGEVETRSPLSKTNQIGTRRRMKRMNRSGVTAGRTNPGNRAHTFRMTLVAQGKLPQIRNLRKRNQDSRYETNETKRTKRTKRNETQEFLRLLKRTKRKNWRSGPPENKNWRSGPPENKKIGDPDRSEKNN